MDERVVHDASDASTGGARTEGSCAGGSRIARRTLLGAALTSGAAAFACRSTGASSSRVAQSGQGAPPVAPAVHVKSQRSARVDYPVLAGSLNAFPGMQLHYAKLRDGADPLDVALEVVKVAEADPNDDSVGLGGLPNEDGVVQLDAACMYGPRHKSGAVACIENILHPSEVARLVMERTDHCLLVGRGAYEFARKLGHPHTELLTEASRKKWLEWKAGPERGKDWLPAPPKIPYQSASRKPSESFAHDEAMDRPAHAPRPTGTIHCSALARDGAIACTTTTSGLAWKISGRVGDSAIVGAGLYCDQEAGSAGSTGRGEACVLANGSFAIVELMRQGASALEAGEEVLRRVIRQTLRQARYQPELVGADGKPSFNLKFYVLALDGSLAGVCLNEGGKFAVADPEHGPHLEELHIVEL